METYVSFFLHSGALISSPVENRELDTLKLPEGVFGFYFFDVTDDGDEANVSKRYYITDRMMSAEDLKQAIRSPEFLSKMLHLMQEANTTHIVRSPEGGYSVPGKDIIYINKKKEILWPQDEAQLEKDKTAQQAEREETLKRLRRMAPKPVFKKKNP